MTDKVKEVLWRVLADVDDRMEFAGTIWRSKESASKDVQKAIDQAAHQLNQMLIEARLDEILKMRAVGDRIAAQRGATFEELSGAYDNHILKRAADLTEEKT